MLTLVTYRGPEEWQSWDGWRSQAIYGKFYVCV